MKKMNEKIFFWWWLLDIDVHTLFIFAPSIWRSPQKLNLITRYFSDFNPVQLQNFGALDELLY